MKNGIGLYLGNIRVPAKLIRTRLGMTWLLRTDAAARHGRRYVPTGAAARIQRELGLREAAEMPGLCPWGTRAVLVRAANTNEVRS